jgi:hypothetical protein
VSVCGRECVCVGVGVDCCSLVKTISSLEISFHVCICLF